MSDQNLAKGAQEMEDLLKQGKTQEFSDRLRSDYTSMSRDEFRDFMHKLSDLNKADMKTNANLPGLELHETHMGGTDAVQKVDLTTPAKYFGNTWRDSETIVSGAPGKGMLSHVGSVITGLRATQYEAMNDGTNNTNVPIEQQR